MTTATKTPTCKVRLEGRSDGQTWARTTHLDELRGPRWTGYPRFSTSTQFCFFTPAGEWLWDGCSRLWTPRLETDGPNTDRWIGLSKLTEVIEVIDRSLAGESTAAIYGSA